MSFDLEGHWHRHVMALPASDGAKAAIFEEIVARHNEGHRVYHGLRHLQSLVQMLEEYAPSELSPEAYLAIWWHDVIYDPRANDNEARSADLAAKDLRILGADEQLIACVVALILATQNHWSGASLGGGDYFLDADIAILGAAEAVYEWYASAVRREYAFAPDSIYRVGRSQFLTRTLSHERLFRTAPFEAAFAEAARQNMRRELASLAAPDA